MPVLPRDLIRRQVVCAERAESALLHGDEHVAAGGEACRERRNLAKQDLGRKKLSKSGKTRTAEEAREEGAAVRQRKQRELRLGAVPVVHVGEEPAKGSFDDREAFDLQYRPLKW